VRGGGVKKRGEVEVGLSGCGDRIINGGDDAFFK
jgi:hypothetical protein